MNSYLVLGLGRFGKSFAKTLYNLGHDVLGVDRDETKVQELSEQLTHVIASECSNEEFLKSLGVNNFDAAIVAIGGDLQSSILATALLKELGCKYIITKAKDDLHAKVLVTVGANRVVFPERDMAIRVANNLASQKIIDIIQLSEDYSIMEKDIPEKWIGKSIIDLDIRSKFQLSVLAIKRGSDLTVNPNPNEKFLDGDIISIMGKNSDIKKLKS